MGGQVALERLKEDKSHAEADLVGDLDAQILELREQRDQEMAVLEQGINSLDETFNQERDRLSEEIITEAQRLQQRVEDALGQPYSIDLYFEKADATIAKKGETAEYAHIEMIKAEVTASLN